MFKCNTNLVKATRLHNLPVDPSEQQQTDTYTVATTFTEGVTYYSDDQGTVADPQPTADNFAQGTYYTKD